MKKSIILLYIVISAMAFCSALYADELRVGVVRNQYDAVENLLRYYKIPYTMIEYREIEKEETYKKYNVLFFPCGLELPIEQNVNIASRGSHVQSISLDSRYYVIDREKAGRLISSFLRKGGNAYFSDFAYTFLNQAMPVFSFNNDFPNLGMEGAVQLKLDNELAAYFNSNVINVNFNHSGWIAPIEIKDSTLLASGKYLTPLGEKEGPISVLLHKGRGEAIYTSYHLNGDYSDYFRYIIHRLCFKNLRKEGRSYIHKWDQRAEYVLIDQVLPGENCRNFRIALGKGWHTASVLSSKKCLYQMDVYGADNQLIGSVDSNSAPVSFEFKLEKDTEIKVNILPLDKTRNEPLILTVGGGKKIFPHYIKLSILAGFLVLLGILFAFKKIIFRRRFSGRVRYR